MNPSTDALLSVTRLTKDYATRVLDQVDFEVRQGEIHGLIGPNGAGKSTLCKIIAGLVSADGGEMRLADTTFLPASKLAAESAGVQIVQQELNLIPTLTVAENVLFGRLPSRCGVIRRRELHERAVAALDRFGLSAIRPDMLVAHLGVGTQQMIEIAAALDRQCRLLILDEPTAALTAAESQKLFQQLAELRRQGVGVIYISHRLDEIAAITDRTTILRDGKVVATRPSESQSTDQLVKLMSGDAVIEATESHRCFTSDRVRLKVAGLSRGSAVRDVGFEVRAGERLGIAGLVGSGRTELLRLIFGADKADHGEIFIDGGATGCRFQSPADATRGGLAMVTEDRKQNGLLLSLAIRDNITLCDLSRLSAAGVTRPGRETAVADQARQQMEIRCSSLQQSVGTLSGGNQQKVVVAKWLVRDRSVYLFDEPTRGIDVAARLRIYRLFDSLASEEKSLVIVSSDVDELMETCDRIAVMSAGRLVAEFTRPDWSRDAIIEASFAGYRDSKSAATEPVL